MRVLADLRTHLTGAPLITQVEKVPPRGEIVAINGKYIVPIVNGVDFPIDSSDYILDGAGEIDGGDISSISYAHLVSMYPMFGNIYFNPLLTPDHVAELDLTAQFKELDPPNVPIYFPTRAQTGREQGIPGMDSGQMPTHTAILPINNGTTPPRPGILITDEIDIGPYTGGVGADEFMVYWWLYDFDVTDDVYSTWGATAGQNTPSVRSITETDQEPDGFSVYLTPDGGANWCPVGLLEPVALSFKTTSFRLAFRNDSDSKVFMATFAILF